MSVLCKKRNDARVIARGFLQANEFKGGRMTVTGALKIGMAGVLVTILTGSAAEVYAATAGGNVVERKTTLESVKSDLEDGLGLTLEQKNKIRTIREEFKARQQAIKNGINAKNEALRQELDGDTPVRARVEPIVVEIKSLQGQLTDNRVDVVFKLREIYSPKQIKMIKERMEQQRKAIMAKKKSKKGKKGKKTLIKHKKP
jgi:Spy/CpxP family protein refolding chaperone